MQILRLFSVRDYCRPRHWHRFLFVGLSGDWGNL